MRTFLINTYFNGFHIIKIHFIWFDSVEKHKKQCIKCSCVFSCWNATIFPRFDLWKESMLTSALVLPLWLQYLMWNWTKNVFCSFHTSMFKLSPAQSKYNDVNAFTVSLYRHIKMCQYFYIDNNLFSFFLHKCSNNCSTSFASWFTAALKMIVCI